ncbi:MAG: heme exporter protein CcmB, partial [Acidimicrobiales bacterium]
MWRDAALVAARDLRAEVRSRITVNQVAPFALLVLILFAFALDPDGPLLERATPGLYWITVLFSALLAIARSAALDETDGVRDALRLSALEPAGVFVGKALAVAAELVALEALLGVGVIILYGADPAGVGLLVATCLAAT